MPCKYQTIFNEAKPKILQPIKLQQRRSKVHDPPATQKSYSKTRGKKEVKESMHALKSL